MLRLCLLTLLPCDSHIIANLYPWYSYLVDQVQPLEDFGTTTERSSRKASSFVEPHRKPNKHHAEVYKFRLRYHCCARGKIHCERGAEDIDRAPRAELTRK